MQPSCSVQSAMAGYFDPNIIQYPVAEPRITLSVSDNPIELKAGLKVPHDFYVEKFILSTNLSETNKSAENPGKFGVFTHQLLISSSKTQSLEIPGKNGESSEKPNGSPGGILELYAEDIQLSTAKKLRLNGINMEVLSRNSEADC